MLSLIILTVGFSNTSFWLTQSLASLCRKPHLLSSLHQVLESIDFKQSSFTWGNIYDTTRSTTHAILRLLFQFNLPIKLSSISNESISLLENTFIFGQNQIANEIIQDFGRIIKSFFLWELNNENTLNWNQNFNIEIINKKIIEEYNTSNFLPPANIVILEADGNSNNNDDIAKACDQYFTDLNISNNESINHVSKDMCSVLLVIFSSYGIYNLATFLGVKFLDKLEQVVDYRFDIIFFKWGSYWNGHRVGIHTGNSLLQIQCLSAFASLFPSANKINYMKSTANYLALLAKYPKLCTLLNYASSVNLTCEGHFYSFDEALEIFGVKFIKENVRENIYNDESLKRQIKSAQAEQERMDLLFGEFIGDIVTSKKDRAVDGRQELFWNLVNSLLVTFESSNLISHSLFQNCKELTDSDYAKLFSCYNNGKERLMQIYRQEVLKIEPINIKG
ncbi:hypothetical protein GLOIN_2v1482460 [Rhizophagus clarus]|uniref:Uncharacterized protein n=1 Tax=Rhizophagus clarus TaxID=94130 RepID=A0A8H3LKA0_9GLOM|nr:hypothetical protein GLOIN_2v1482460 [Rhizophagus clarus]